MHFTKIQATGNDFIMVEDWAGALELASEQVARLCDRHFGIGADGIIQLRTPASGGAAAYMHYINADGSLAEMCGNGVRAVGRYLVAQGRIEELPGGAEFAVETLGGLKELVYDAAAADGAGAFSVNMGKPELLGTKQVEDLQLAAVKMPNPHAVALVEDFDFDLAQVGRIVENATAVFPEKTNVEFVQVQNPLMLKMRVWERGVGETLSCGTGACAAVVACASAKLAERKVEVEVAGGKLQIEWQADDTVSLSGPAEIVYEGEIEVA
ncbi:MAG: diaminopimelate epimerase [Coriobacteriales bacterium]|jgi:diaminopimelate epimerase|nr:diaminopimelate epimerase [Coriobacteriales bacterium]